MVRPVQVAPPSVETCHWYVGAGVPLAATMNDVFEPADTVWLAGCVVIAGARLTVNVAAFDVAEPTLLLATARY